jgi:hypothetical protein
LEGDWKAIIPVLKLLLEMVPIVEQCPLIHTCPSASHLWRNIIAGGHEVYKLSHKPDESIANQVLFHHALAFWVATFGGITGYNETVVIDQKAGFLPKCEVFGIESSMGLVDNCDARLRRAHELGGLNLQAASISCLAMFQKVALRAFEVHSRPMEAIDDLGVGICKGIIRSCAITSSDLAPFRCLAHSGTEASRNS